MKRVFLVLALVGAACLAFAGGKGEGGRGGGGGKTAATKTAATKTAVPASLPSAVTSVIPIGSASAQQFAQWPVANACVISSSTGPRERIKTNGGATSSFHEGTDMPAPAGTPVKAVKSGVVLDSTSTKKLGGQISTYNTDSSVSTYTHVVSDVNSGQFVSKGQEIGKVGVPNGTGGTMSTGSHLDYSERHANGCLVSTAELKMKCGVP